MWLKRRLWPAVAELGMAFAGLVLGYLLVATIFSVLGTGPLTLLAGPLITGVAAVFYANIGPKWAAAVEDPNDQDPEPPEPVPPRAQGLVAVAATVLVGLAVALGGSVALGVLFDAIGMRVEEQSSVLEITEAARTGGIRLDAVLLVFSALLLAPLVEEWLFRGLLFRRVTERSGRLLGYGISALGFAAIHGNPAGFVVYLWLGVVFAAVMERTGRLEAAMAVHLGNNGYVLAVLFTAGGG